MDEWLDIEFRSSQVAMELLEIGSWLRYAWLAVIDKKLKNFDKISSNLLDRNIEFVPEENGLLKNGSVKNHLDTIEYIPQTIQEMRKSWIELRLLQNQLSEDEILDRLVEFVGMEVEYTCRKLRMTNIETLFGYEPYTEKSQNECVVHVTPNFKYYISPKRLSLKEAQAFKLPMRKQQKSAPSKPAPIIESIKEISELDKEDTQRRMVQCLVCQKSLYMTSMEINRHQKLCGK